TTTASETSPLPRPPPLEKRRAGSTHLTPGTSTSTSAVRKGGYQHNQYLPPALVRLGHAAGRDKGGFVSEQELAIGFYPVGSPLPGSPPFRTLEPPTGYVFTGVLNPGDLNGDGLEDALIEVGKLNGDFAELTSMAIHMGRANGLSAEASVTLDLRTER